MRLNQLLRFYTTHPALHKEQTLHVCKMVFDRVGVITMFLG